jgi:hypothetical protein
MEADIKRDCVLYVSVQDSRIDRGIWMPVSDKFPFMSAMSRLWPALKTESTTHELESTQAAAQQLLNKTNWVCQT